MSELWVFGYGSLMWRPDFPFVERRRARLVGLHRSLCVWSFVHRGTEARPGLVLGLDRGGACVGVAFRVAAAERERVVAALREREQVTAVYLERVRPIIGTGEGERLSALTYVVDRAHRQYAGVLDTDTQVATVEGAAGRSGPNRDYVLNTVDHLRSLGIRDRGLEAVAARLRTGPAPA